MNAKQRIKQLEKQREVFTVKKYLCFIDSDMTEGYKIQPCNGAGGEPMHFGTRSEVDAFGMRPEVDLTIVIYSDEEPNKGGDE